jgi:hypothetical protein
LKIEIGIIPVFVLETETKTETARSETETETKTGRSETETKTETGILETETNQDHQKPVSRGLETETRSRDQHHCNLVTVHATAGV